MPAEQRRELPARQLQHMERVGRRPQRRVHVPVRRADDQQPVRPKHALDLAQEHVLLGQVLQRFERDHHVHAGIRHRQHPRIAGFIAQVRARELAPRGIHGGRVDLHTHHAARHLRQQRAAVSFARGHIQHVPPAAQVPRQQVAVVMLHLDLPGYGTRQPLTTEAKRFGGGFAPYQLTHGVDALAATCRPRQLHARPGYVHRPAFRRAPTPPTLTAQPHGSTPP